MNYSGLDGSYIATLEKQQAREANIKSSGIQQNIYTGTG